MQKVIYKHNINILKEKTSNLNMWCNRRTLKIAHSKEAALYLRIREKVL